MRVKRPLCTALFIWAAVIWLLGRAGIPFFTCSPPKLAGQVKGENILATGIVYQKDVYETITNLYLKKANLIIQEEQHPTERIKLTMDNKALSGLTEQGDFIAVYGKLEEIPEGANPGQFNERAYYYARNIKWYMEGEEMQLLQRGKNQMLSFQGRVKEKMRGGIQKAFGEEKGGIMEAMILGEKENLGQENKLLFQIMGISHILAISGTHLSVLGWGFYKILLKCQLPIKASCLISAAVMIFYGELTGSQAAAVRAVLMFGVSVGAMLLKRTYDFLSALSLAAVFLLAESPLYLYDSSFLLSFGAVFGLAAVHPVLFPPERKKNRMDLPGKIQRGLKNVFFSSLSVWSILLPVTMYFFYEISTWGFLVNLLILPTTGILLVSGLAGGILGLLPVVLPGKAGALPGIILLELYLRGGEIIQELPASLWITGRPELWQCAVYYGMLAGTLWIKKIRTDRKVSGKWTQMVQVIVLGVGIVLLFIRFPEGELKVTFLDVGQGDCACIQKGRESCYLIDGGSSSVSKAGQYRILPFLKEQGIRKVDGIFLSHMDEDHINGILELLEMTAKRETGLKIQRIFLSRSRETEETQQRIKEAGEKAGCEVLYIGRGDRIRDGKLEMTCLSPKNENMESNEGSQVIWAEMEEFSLLFTGDVEGRGEEELLALCRETNIQCDILKVAHHGSKNSTSEEFLDIVSPQAAVISCGRNNLYGHPHQELMERLKKKGIFVFETKNRGAISAVWKKEKIQVSFQY